MLTRAQLIKLTTGIAGALAFTMIQSSGAGSLILTDTTKGTPENWAITGNVTVDGQGNVTLTATPPSTGGGGCTGPGTLGFSSTSYSVAEGSSTSITVNRTVCAQGAVTVNYATSDGSALAGTDYTTASGTLSWADGVTGPKTFNVATQGEATPVSESNKTVSLALSAISGGATQGTAAATLNITDVGSSTDPTCPAPPSGLTIRDTIQNLGTNDTYKNAANQAYAIRITPGASGEVSWSSAQVTGITSTSQIVSVSRCRGDFTQTYPCGQNSSQSYIGYLKASTAAFSTCRLDPAISTYYVNVRNATFSSGADTCGSGKVCGLLLNVK